jgi:hypothetical protein
MMFIYFFYWWNVLSVMDWIFDEIFRWLVSVIWIWIIDWEMIFMDGVYDDVFSDIFKDLGNVMENGW